MENKWNGGLGVQKCSIKNKALLARLAWRLFKNLSSLWRSTLLDIYTKSTCLKDSTKHKNHTNTVWKNIKVGWKSCNTCLHWLVGNGENINLWTDAWIPNSPPLRSLISGPLTQYEADRKVSSIIENGLWSLNSLPFNLHPHLTSLIQRIHLSRIPNLQDKPFWSLSKDGCFSTSSAYQSIKQQHRRDVQNPKNSQWIWKLSCPNKIKYFLWICQNGKLP